MKDKKLKKAMRVYGLIGKSLCSCAGVIVGYIFGGPVAAIVGVVIGTLAGDFLEKNMEKAIL